MNACCENSAHAQIEYPGEAGPVESLVGVNPKDPETVKLLHAMLDEWLSKKRTGNPTPDHFIVFRRWPKELV